MALFQRIKKLFRPLLDDHGIQELKKTPPTGRRRTGQIKYWKHLQGAQNGGEGGRSEILQGELERLELHLSHSSLGSTWRMISWTS